MSPFPQARTTSVLPYFLSRPRWQTFTMLGHNDDNIIGSDAPYPEHKTAVQTFRQTQGRLGASALSSKPGHSLINFRKPTTTISTSWSQESHRHIHFKTRLAKIYAGYIEKSKRKSRWTSNGGLASRYNCIVLKRVFVQVWGQPVLRGGLPWLHTVWPYSLWLSQSWAWCWSLFPYLKVNLPLQCVASLHVLFCDTCGRKSGVFLFLIFLSPSFLIEWSFWSYQAAEIQANGEWCVV